jgi:predicted NBD/HSP70 family sugar kinase
MAEKGLLNARQLNRLKVIEALYRRPGSSRTEVAEYTALSRPTVSMLIEELEGAGIVRQHDADDSRPRQTGRPPVLMSLVPRAAFAVGLDMGHEHVRAAVCDLSGQILADDFSAAEVDHAPMESLDLARELVFGVLSEAGVTADHVIGVGMALAAPVDRETGFVFAEGILPNWGGVQPAAEMQARLGLPVQLENDANLGALGEHVFGAGHGADDMVYVRLSAGVGVGLILGGRPYHGRTGIAGELGHVRVDPRGAICRCGNRGCLETVAAPRVVAALLERTRQEPITVARLLELVHAGDRGARRAVADAGAMIGEAVAAVVNVLNPELIVIGGDLAAAGPTLLDAVRAAIDRFSVAPAAGAVRVAAGMLGERAEVLGAAALLLAQSPHTLALRVPDA